MNALSHHISTVLDQLSRFSGKLKQISHFASGSTPRVLFAAGLTGAPFRYRVQNSIEQLSMQRISAISLDATDPALPLAARACDLLYLYRTSTEAPVQQAMQIARRRAVPVLYDTDDLTWEPKVIEYCNIEARHGHGYAAWLHTHIADCIHAMQQADLFSVSTEYLAARLRADFGRPVIVHENAVSQQALTLSAPLYARRLAEAPRATVTLAYFSGWPRAHEEDFGVALPAILRLLQNIPHTRLRIVGHFDADFLPAALRPQIEVRPFVPWEQLFEQLAEIDINLAPLVDNPHRRAKSAVKYLEAALVGVPTVASAMEPYERIGRRQTGLIADNADAWYDALHRLATNSELRQSLGRAAHDQVTAEETTTARAAGFAEFVREVETQYIASLPPAHQ